MRLHDFHRAPPGPSAFRSDLGAAAAACVLAQEDGLALLECLHRHPRHDPWVIALAQAKVALARFTPVADLAPDRITIGTRVAFGLGGGEPEMAVLAPWDEEPAPLGRIALRTRLGIALLGMREGASVDVPRHDGIVDRLTIHEVAYRPGVPMTSSASAANDNRGSQEVRS